MSHQTYKNELKLYLVILQVLKSNSNFKYNFTYPRVEVASKRV